MKHPAEGRPPLPYSPNEPRNQKGQWTSGGSGTAASTTSVPIGFAGRFPHVTTQAYVREKPDSIDPQPYDPAVAARADVQAMSASAGRRVIPSRSDVARSLKAVDFVIRQVGEGLFSRYGKLGFNSEVGGRLAETLHGTLAPKCNFLVFDAYASSGSAPRLANGRTPRAEDWGNLTTSISTSSGTVFKVVAIGNLSKFNLYNLKSGDVISNGHHVGIYTPRLYTDGQSHVEGFSELQITNLGNTSTATPRRIWIRPQTISAATPNERNINSDSRNEPRWGGVTWNGWGFRGDSYDNEVVVRRLVSSGGAS